MEANVQKVSSPDAAEMQRLLELIAAKAGKLRSCVETVQCVAVDTRLALIVDKSAQNPDRAVQAARQLAKELGSMADDIETLVAEMRTASIKVTRYALA